MIRRCFMVWTSWTGPAPLRPGDRLPFPVLTLAETAERVQVVVSWKDDAGPTRVVHGAVAVVQAG
jgi:hypothetical protein